MHESNAWLPCCWLCAAACCWDCRRCCRCFAPPTTMPAAAAPCFLLDVAVEPVIGLVLVASYLCRSGPGGGTDGCPLQSTALRRRCRGSGL